MTDRNLQLKQPRNRVGSTNTHDDYYKFYKNSLKAKEKKSSYNVDKKTHRKIINMFNDLLCEKLLEGRAVTLPAGLGELCVTTNKMTSERAFNKVDWGHWRKTGEIKKFDNPHTDYKTCKTYWKRGHVANIKLFEFITCRNLSRAIAAKALNGGADDFIELVKVPYPKKESNDLPYHFE